MLIQNVPTNQVEVWSAKVGDSSVNGARQSNTAGVHIYPNVLGSKTLGIKLHKKISNLIHQRTLQVANFVVISPSNNLNQPILSSDSMVITKVSYALCTENWFIKPLDKVHKNPYMTENVILMAQR
jgi:hypothetical protein